MSSPDFSQAASMPDGNNPASAGPTSAAPGGAGPAGAPNGESAHGWHYPGGAAFEGHAFLPRRVSGYDPVHDAGGSSAEQASGMDSAALWKAFRRRWALAIAVGIIGAAGCATAAWMLLPPAKYLAHSLLHVASVPESVMGGAGPAGVDFGNYQRSQIVMVKSRPVLNAALRNPKVAELASVQEQADAVEWLEKALIVEYKEGPEFLTIALKGDRPDELKAVVDSVTETYLAEVVHKEDNKRTARLGRLQELYGKFEEVLRTKQDTLNNLTKSFSGSLNSKVNAVKHEFALSSLQQAKTELLQHQSRLRALNVEYGILKVKQKSLDDVTVPDSAVEDALDKDPMIKQELEKVAGYESLLKEIEKAAAQGKEDRLYKRREGEMQNAKALVAARRAKLRPEIVAKERRKFLHDFQAHLVELESRIELVKANEKVVDALVVQLATETREISGKSVDVEGYKEEIESAQDMTKRLSGQIEALKMELLAPPRIEKMQDAIVSNTNDQKKQIAATGGAGLGAFGLLVFGISWWEYRARRITSVEDAVRGLGLRLVGVLPALPNRSRSRGRHTAGSQELLWNNQLTESVDTTRTMVLHAGQGNNMRTVMITSALPGEGKTSLSSQLAASMARAGRKTLLIDGDLRNPAGHKLFSFPVGPGMSEVLRGEAELGTVVRQTPIRGLWLLPAGEWNQKTAEALAEKGVGAVLEPLKQQFDFIVIDSSPVLAVVDALLIGQSADAVLLSILREVSRMPAIQAAYQRLHALGIRMLGCVVNGTAANDQVYGGAYGYGYGYGRHSAQQNSGEQ